MEKLLLDAAKPTLGHYLDKILEQLDLAYQTTLKKDREHFMRYLERTDKKFSEIRPVGFREALNFNDIYIPLTLELDNRKKEEYVIDSFPKELVLKHKHLLIVDNAGMGKSTISKRMFMKAYEDGSCGIPIFVELRHLSEEHNILKEIFLQIENLSSDFNEKLLKILLEKGDFVIFLDGYDEISLSEKSEVTKSLQAFVEKLPNTIFILTSRQDDALTGFQSFCQYSIKQLEEEDAYRLLSNLDNKGKKSKHLIEVLKDRKIDGIKEFLVNPLLVTLLYTAFDFEQTIPTKKHLFYDQVFNAFFQQHDFSKEGVWVHDKKSKLEKDDFERILRCLGFASVLNHKVEFTRTEIINYINKAKEKCNLTFMESDFLYDLILSVPLFLREGQQYKWAHKSLSEYFAVEYIAIDTMDNEKNYVEKLYDTGMMQVKNIFDLYYDIKPSGFNQFLLLPCLEDIKDELLSQDDDLERIYFCTTNIGRDFIIQPEGRKILPEKYESLIYFRLPGYEAFILKKPSAKWWCILNILIEKQCLFKFPYNIDKTKKDVSHLISYLSKNHILKINSTNILQIDPKVVEEVNSLLNYSFVWLLTKEDCEKKITQINKEIKDKEDLSSWII